MKWLIAILAAAVATPAAAYVGPGLGAGVVAVALGVIGSIFLGIFAVIYYPIKRVLRRKKAAATPRVEPAE